MGYSIYVRAKDLATQNKMYDFLNKNLRPLGVSEQDTGYRLAQGKSRQNGLAYGYGNYPIGFDYCSWVRNIESEYIHEIIKWVSAKIGDGKHYYYDDELTEITHTHSEMYMDFLKRECKGRGLKVKEIVSTIQAEIDRLNTLWDLGLCDADAERQAIG
jgi:hypothetical protein